MPNVTTYMDGKKVGHGTWQYPIGFTDTLVLGQWNTEKSHDGLIDELRLYKRALDVAEIELLADRQGRDSGEIKIVQYLQIISSCSTGVSGGDGYGYDIARICIANVIVRRIGEPFC